MKAHGQTLEALNAFNPKDDVPTTLANWPTATSWLPLSVRDQSMTVGSLNFQVQHSYINLSCVWENEGRVAMGYSHLSAEERAVIMIEQADGSSMRSIGRLLGRSASTISRELRRQPLHPRGYDAGSAGRRYLQQLDRILFHFDVARAL